jgi:Flp pilus assembly protein TadG
MPESEIRMQHGKLSLCQHALARTLRTVASLRQDRSGMALVEFAMGAPIFLALGMSAVEVANFSVTSMRVSQIGMNVADNIARAGILTAGSTQQLLESHIEDTFEGARIQGSPIEFQQRGRVIVSSLQRNALNGQWIAWQRCYGQKNFTSSYGVAGVGRTVTTFTGMGPTGDQITAPGSGPVPASPAIDSTNGTGVIFVELAYDYHPIVDSVASTLQFFGLRLNNQTIRYKQAFIVRNPRQLGDSTDAAPTATEDYGLFQNSPAITRRTLPGSGSSPNYSNAC